MKSRMLVGSVLLLCAMAVVVPVVSADMVTAQALKGKVYLTVTAEFAPVYGVLISLTRGSVRAWEAPVGWVGEQWNSYQVFFTVEGGPLGEPLAIGDVASGFMLKASGSGAWSEWMTMTNEDVSSSTCEVVEFPTGYWCTDWDWFDLK
jgi:hypothetical protein